MRALGSLPWPTSIGKDLEYPGLRGVVLDYMNPPSGGSRSFEAAFGAEAGLRAAINEALSSAVWAASLERIDEALTIGRTSPLLGRVLTDVDPWRQWARPLVEAHGPLVRHWVYYPILLAGSGIGDGRHRLTYLRLHHDPSYPVLVRVNHAR
ncbi:MAG: hypothetical protein WBO08_17915 [Mycobacterium sp.]